MRDLKGERETDRARERISNYKNVKGAIPPQHLTGVAYVIIPPIVRNYKHFDKYVQIFNQYQWIWLQKLLILL